MEATRFGSTSPTFEGFPFAPLLAPSRFGSFFAPWSVQLERAPSPEVRQERTSLTSRSPPSSTLRLLPRHTRARAGGHQRDRATIHPILLQPIRQRSKGSRSSLREFTQMSISRSPRATLTLSVFEPFAARPLDALV